MELELQRWYLMLSHTNFYNVVQWDWLKEITSIPLLSCFYLFLSVSFSAWYLARYFLPYCAAQRGIWDNFSCRRTKVSNNYEIYQFKTQQHSGSSQGILHQVNVLNFCFYSRSPSPILLHSAAGTFHSTAKLPTI